MLKFILSPTKTMKPSLTSSHQIPQFDFEAQPLKAILQAMRQDELKTHFKLSDKLSQALYERMHPWQEQQRAIEAYHGQQFKSLDVFSLDAQAQDYLEKHVMILSGLYGPLKPNDRIAFYRAPLDEGLPQTSLIAFWQERLNATFNDHLWVNCASAEYAQLVPDHAHRIDVDFVVAKGSKLTRPAMILKTMRGLFIRYAAIKQAQTIEDLTAFQAEGFRLNFVNDTTLQFIQKR